MVGDRANVFWINGWMSVIALKLLSGCIQDKSLNINDNEVTGSASTK